MSQSVAIAALLVLWGQTPQTSLGERAAPAAEESHPRAERCCAFALAACLLTLRREHSVSEIDRLTGGKGAETSLLDCAAAVRQLQLQTASFRWDRMPEDLDLHKTPAVLPVVLKNGRTHFVAAVDSRPNQFLVFDYPYPPSWMESSALRKEWRWDGSMLHVAEDSAALERLQALAGRRFSPLLMVSGVAVLVAGIVVMISARRSVGT